MPSLDKPALDIPAVLATNPVLDGHNDIDIAARGDRTHTDLPRLREGGVGGQFWSVYAPGTLSPIDAVTATFEQIDVVHHLLQRYAADLAFATTVPDIRAAWETGRIASLLGAEGGHCIGNSLGVLRMMGALWFAR